MSSPIERGSAGVPFRDSGAATYRNTVCLAGMRRGTATRSAKCVPSRVSSGPDRARLACDTPLNTGLLQVRRALIALRA